VALVQVEAALWKMEVLVKNTAKISDSCKKIELPEGWDEVAVVTNLGKLLFINNFLKVVVIVKELQVPEAMTVTGEKQK